MCLDRANTFSNNITTVKAKQKQSTVFLSSTNSLPDANISWMHNGNPIDTTLSKYEMVEKDSLRITDLKTSDSGVYREQYNYYGCIFL